MTLNICLLIPTLHILIHSFTNLWSNFPLNKELFTHGNFYLLISQRHYKQSRQQAICWRVDPAKARSGSLRPCGLRRTKEDHSRKEAELMRCTRPKINKVGGSSSLLKLLNQNYLPVIGMAFQELMPSLQSRLESREYQPSVCDYYIL